MYTLVWIIIVYYEKSGLAVTISYQNVSREKKNLAWSTCSSSLNPFHFHPSIHTGSSENTILYYFGLNVIIIIIIRHYNCYNYLRLPIDILYIPGTGDVCFSVSRATRAFANVRNVRHEYNELNILKYHIAFWNLNSNQIIIIPFRSSDKICALRNIFLYSVVAIILDGQRARTYTRVLSTTAAVAAAVTTNPSAVNFQVPESILRPPRLQPRALDS